MFFHIHCLNDLLLKSGVREVSTGQRRVLGKNLEKVRHFKGAGLQLLRCSRRRAFAFRNQCLPLKTVDGISQNSRCQLKGCRLFDMAPTVLKGMDRSGKWHRLI